MVHFCRNWWHLDYVIQQFCMKQSLEFNLFCVCSKCFTGAVLSFFCLLPPSSKKLEENLVQVLNCILIDKFCDFTLFFRSSHNLPSYEESHSLATTYTGNDIQLGNSARLVCCQWFLQLAHLPATLCSWNLLDNSVWHNLCTSGEYNQDGQKFLHPTHDLVTSHTCYVHFILGQVRSACCKCLTTHNGWNSYTWIIIGK